MQYYLETIADDSENKISIDTGMILEHVWPFSCLRFNTDYFYAIFDWETTVFEFSAEKIPFACVPEKIFSLCLVENHFLNYEWKNLAGQNNGDSLILMTCSPESFVKSLSYDKYTWQKKWREVTLLPLFVFSFSVCPYFVAAKTIH